MLLLSTIESTRTTVNLFFFKMAKIYLPRFFFRNGKKIKGKGDIVKEVNKLVLEFKTLQSWKEKIDLIVNKIDL